MNPPPPPVCWGGGADWLVFPWGGGEVAKCKWPAFKTKIDLILEAFNTWTFTLLSNWKKNARRKCSTPDWKTSVLDSALHPSFCSDNERLWSLSSCRIEMINQIVMNLTNTFCRWAFHKIQWTKKNQSIKKNQKALLHLKNILQTNRKSNLMTRKEENDILFWYMHLYCSNGTHF